MMRTTIVSLVAGLGALVAAAGCKEKVVEPDPQTKADLDQCLKNKAEQDKLIKDVEADNARLQRAQAGAGEITVNIEGNALTVKPGAPGEQRPIDDAAVAATSKEFLNVVARSRGDIQRCYERALKNNTGLQAKTVTLSVSASFEKSGQFHDASTSPSLGASFDGCFHTLATKWSLPTTSPAMTFKAQVSLTPS